MLMTYLPSQRSLNKLEIPLIFFKCKKIHEGNDQEKAQSEIESLSKNRDIKRPN